MHHMTTEDIICWRNLAIVIVIIAVLQFLCLVACREVVKTDLRQRCCEPISVRFFWWRFLFSGWLGIPWRVVYSDYRGAMHRAICRVYWDRHTTWDSDEIIGNAQ
jgi:hypothetical protein